MSITSRSPRFSDRTRRSTSSRIGPGSYNISGSITIKEETPYPFLTTSARTVDSSNDRPGPGHYTPIVPSNNIHGGSAIISSTSHLKFDAEDTPAPDSYSRIQNWAGKMRQHQYREPMSSRAPRNLFSNISTCGTPADFDLRPKMERGAVISKSSRHALIQ